MKSRSFNTFLFQEFYKDMISTHEFFYCTSLSAGYRKETF